MLYTFRSLHIHHSYYLSFSYCLSTQWHSLSRNPLPRSEIQVSSRLPYHNNFVDNSGFTRFSFCQIRHLGLGSPITPAHLRVMTKYTCYSTLYDLCAMLSSFSSSLIYRLFLRCL